MDSDTSDYGETGSVEDRARAAARAGSGSETGADDDRDAFIVEHFSETRSGFAICIDPDSNTVKLVYHGKRPIHIHPPGQPIVSRSGRGGAAAPDRIAPSTVEFHTNLIVHPPHQTVCLIEIEPALTMLGLKLNSSNINDTTDPRPPLCLNVCHTALPTDEKKKLFVIPIRTGTVVATIIPFAHVRDATVRVVE